MVGIPLAFVTGRYQPTTSYLTHWNIRKYWYLCLLPCVNDLEKSLSFYSRLQIRLQILSVLFWERFHLSNRQLEPSYGKIREDSRSHFPNYELELITPKSFRVLRFLKNLKTHFFSSIPS